VLIPLAPTRCAARDRETAPSAPPAPRLPGSTSLASGWHELDTVLVATPTASMAYARPVPLWLRPAKRALCPRGPLACRGAGAARVHGAPPLPLPRRAAGAAPARLSRGGHHRQPTQMRAKTRLLELETQPLYSAVFCSLRSRRSSCACTCILAVLRARVTRPSPAPTPLCSGGAGRLPLGARLGRAQPDARRGGGVRRELRRGWPGGWRDAPR